MVRPILVLPPTDIKVIECEQSEEERDFYDALFKRSKVSLLPDRILLPYQRFVQIRITLLLKSSNHVNLELVLAI